MTIKQTISGFAVGFFLIAAMSQVVAPTATADCKEDKDKGVICCGDVETSIIGGEVCKTGGKKDTLEGSAIWALLLLAINILTAGVGIAAVGGIVVAGLRYSAARENAGEVTKAKEMILNIAIGLVAYAAMYAFLQFLIPGGIFT